MIRHSVGRNGINRALDVRVIQQVINLREDLRPAMMIPAPGRSLPPVTRRATPPLAEDGVLGPATQGHIDRIEDALRTAPSPRPDGRIEPSDPTLRRMWPPRYGFPTALTSNGFSHSGSEQDSVTRGPGYRDCADYFAVAGQEVRAPMSGVVSRIWRPCTSGIDAALLHALEIEASDGTTCMVCYLHRVPAMVGTVVRAGVSVIGLAAAMSERRRETAGEHLRVRIRMRDGRRLDPVTLIR